MKKIVFATIPMQSIEGEGWDTDGYFYRFEDNKPCEYPGKVHFAVNGFLAATLKKDENVKIVRICMDSKVSKRNIEIQKSELKNLNRNIGANIKYEAVKTDFCESAMTMEQRFRDIIGKLEDGCDIVLDMTFCSKPLVPLLFYVLSFAEKFFNADIKNILYEKTNFIKLPSGKTVPDPDTCELYDITSLYYLNSLTSVMSAPDSKTALERLNKFLSL